MSGYDVMRWVVRMRMWLKCDVTRKRGVRVVYGHQYSDHLPHQIIATTLFTPSVLRNTIP